MANPSEKLDTLYEELLVPVIRASRGGCPDALVDRFYAASSRALSLLATAEATKASDASAVPQVHMGGEKGFSNWNLGVEKIQNDLRRDMAAAEEDWLMVLLARKGNVVAEDELLLKYKPKIEYVKSRFVGRYPEIQDDLVQEGLLAFSNPAILKYDPSQGATLWEYAAVIVYRKMRDVCKTWKRSDISSPLYKAVMKEVDRLLGESGVEPSDKELAATLEASVDDIHSARWWNRNREEVSLSEMDDSQMPHAQEERLEADPFRVVMHRAQYESILHCFKSYTDPAANEGIRWLLVFLLKNFEGYDWNEITSVLTGALRVDWPSLRDAYVLPDGIPIEPAQIDELFANGPKLTAVNLRRWYGRRLEYVTHLFRISENQVDLDS